MQINWEMEGEKWKIQRGISLIEILIVVTIFSVLGILVTQSIALTLQGAKKSAATVAVRENLDYSISVIQRQLTNANSIVDCTTPAPTPSSRIGYVDQYGTSTYFLWTSAMSAIASGSATTLLTSHETVKVTSATFTCVAETSVNQPYVNVSLTAQSATSTGAQSSPETVNTRIYLRNY